jgi:hypothetical protein
MNNKIKAALLAVSLTVLAGCSSTPASLDRKALAANKITAVDLSSPEKITYTKSQTAARTASMTGFGLLGAVVAMGVDGAVNMNRAKVLDPIIKGMGNFNTNEVFKRKLASIKGPSFAPGLKVTGYTVPVESKLNVLNVTTGYVLSANHQVVTVSALTKIKTSEKAPIYSRRFAENSTIETGRKEGEKLNVTEWLAKNPSKLRQAIERGMDVIVRKIALDINTGTPAAK